MVRRRGRQNRTDVRRQATESGHLPSPFRCWRCGKPLILRAGGLECTNGDARHRPRKGVLDLLPPGEDPPPDVFDTWYGSLYDAGVNRRRLAVPGGFLLWGADIASVLRLMAGAIACLRGEIVLDAPTGGGITFARGAPATHGLLIGVDLSRPMLERAVRRRRAAGLRPERLLLARADATRLPLLDASVDRVACFNSLHCIPNQRALLEEFRRVLKPGGELVGTTLVEDAPLPWRLNVEVARLAGFFIPPDSGRLRRLARAAGFRRWSTEQSGALLSFHGE